MNQNKELSTREESAPERVNQRPFITPFVDVYENKNELLLIADVPGANKDSVAIHFDKGQLTIEARRTEESSGNLVYGEFHTRDYYRSFSVPNGIDASKIDAQLNAGILRVRLPKSEAVKPRQIEVKVG